MESKNTTYVKQAAILASAMIFSRFLGFLYRLPLTHLIGDEGNAYYAAGYQIYNFFLILSSAGLPAAISKMVSEREALKRYRDSRAVFRVALTLACVMGMICSLIVLFGARVISSLTAQPLSYYSLLMLSPTLLIVAIVAVFRGYFQGLGTTKPTAISQIVEQIFNVIFSVLLAYLLYTRGPEFGAAGGTAGTGVGALAGLIVIVIIYNSNLPRIRRITRRSVPRQESEKSIIIKLLQTSFPIIVGTAVFSISSMIDTFMIGQCLRASGAFTAVEIAEKFGQYSGKYIVLITLPVTISSAMATASVPSIAASVAKKERDAVNRKINTGLRASMLICVPAAIGMSVLGEGILSLLFPGAPGGGELLRWGGVAVIFLSMAQICTGMLQGIGRVKIPVVGAVCGALLKIPLNLVLISNPAINVIGAVLSTLVCYIAAASIDLYFLIRCTKIKLDFGSVFFKPLGASVVMGIIALAAYKVLMTLIGSNLLSVAVAVACGLLAYGVIMILIGGIRPQDISGLPFIGGKLRSLLGRRSISLK